MRVVTEVVIYGTGSSILADVEESLHRCGIGIRVGVRNRPGACFLSDMVRGIRLEDLDADLISLPFVVPLFAPAHRQTASAEAVARGFVEPASVVDPTAVLPRGVAHGPGLYVNAGSIIGAGVVFGAGVFVNRASSIGHHGEIADFVSIGPGCVLAGQVSIGRGAMIGAGAVLLPKATVGENAVVAAGSVVREPVPPHTLVAGNPARVVRADIAGYKDLRVS